MKNKLIVLLMMISLAFVFSSCSSNNASSMNGASSHTTPGDVVSDVISDLISGGEAIVSDMK